MTNPTDRLPPLDGHHEWTLRTLAERFPDFIDVPISLGINDIHLHFETTRPYRGWQGVRANFGGSDGKTPVQLRLDAAMDVGFRKRNTGLHTP